MKDNVLAICASIDTFRSRCDEIDRIVSMLVFMRDHRGSKLTSNSNDFFDMDRELEKTLRASVYLMLYNLVEATMTTAIDAIHNHIENEKVGFDGLKENIRRIAMNGFRKAVSNSSKLPDRLFDSSIPVSNALIWLGLDKKELFSGNLDGRLIKQTASDYGFEVAKHDTSTSKDGYRLLDVKTKRNELAHGCVSFEQCGHESSIDDLIAIFNETKVFLQAVLDGINQYLADKAYLHESFFKQGNRLDEFDN